MDIITLAELADALATTSLLDRAFGDKSTTICGAAHDSRDVVSGNIFVCKGAAFSPTFLTSALDAGAVAYLCESSAEPELAQAAPGVPHLTTSDIRRAMSVVASLAWGRPDRDMEVVGITGTKGKSSVTYMVRSILDGDEPGSHAGIMGSIDTYDGIEHFESHNTTPEAPELWRHLYNARSKGLTMVMEVSSQGLKHERCDYLTMDIGVFLNIGRDHISPVEHPTFEDYFASKLRIFEKCRRAVVNLDTDDADAVLEAAKKCQEVVLFSTTSSDADFWASDITPGHGNVTFTCHTPEWTGPVTVGMSGLFNVDNALAAIAICQLLGSTQEQCVAGLTHVRVPGRMELVENEGGDIVCVIDYAHNGLSFRKLFESLQSEYPGRAIVAVFGAPGNKAQERRVELPQVASEYCDHLVYTMEDPAHEDPADICRQMCEATPAGQSHEAIVDREEAIRVAILKADELGRACGKGSIVALLAKGDETRQHIGDEYPPMVPDGQVAERVLASLNAAD